jgi:acetyl-CoA acetyltransferase family protein
MFSQFEGAELLAEKFGLTKDEMSEFGFNSHRKAAAATDAGRFKNDILPLQTKDKNNETVTMSTDEGIRRDVNLEKMKSLNALKPGGRITAGASSQISDGASAVLVVNERALAKYNLRPRAKIVQMSVIGSDPVMMLYGPIPASELALKQSGLKIEQMDLYEINEAFASVPLSWLKALKGDPNKLNVNGGAVANGHPLGATGMKLMTGLINELERRKGRYGIMAICEGGGTANCTIIERVDTNAKL